MAIVRNNRRRQKNADSSHTRNVLKIAHAEGYGYYDDQFWQLLRFSISNPLHSKDILVENLATLTHGVHLLKIKPDPFHNNI